jgi:type II secretory pathway component PulK
MRRHQNGITLIGWLVLLIPLAIIVYAGIRLVPAYLTYFSVSRSLQQVASTHAGEADLNASVLRQSLAKRFDVEDIKRPTVEEILIQREDGVWTLEADYSVSVPLLGGISVSVDFDKHVQVQ